MKIIYDQPEIWSIADIGTVWVASKTVELALESYTDLECDDPLNVIFGTQHFRFNNSLRTWAHSTGNVVIFRRGYVILPLVIHELGHTFDRRAKLQPQKQMVADKIDLRAGSLWGGLHPATMAGGERPAERWANLFADWAMQMLARNAAGDNLRSWMDAHMGEWVVAAMAAEVKA